MPEEEIILVQDGDLTGAVDRLAKIWALFQRHRGELEDALDRIADDSDERLSSSVRMVEVVREALVYSFAPFERREEDDVSWRHLGKVAEQGRYAFEYGGALRTLGRTLRMLIDDERDMRPAIAEFQIEGQYVDANFEELEKYGATMAGMSATRYLDQYGDLHAQQARLLISQQEQYERALALRAAYEERLRVLRAALVRTHTLLSIVLNVQVAAGRVQQLV